MAVVYPSWPGVIMNDAFLSLDCVPIQTINYIFMWLTTQGKGWNIVSFSLYGLSAHFGNVWQQISQLI